ncbi:hypothetical protein ACMD2_21418 [Ananas comosus]|uniref:CAAX prenyl protease 2/Lysostaphin resistance protein A-like domain-containing protein n=1 Tax=Ananas comosus TaxID=4615 RepID=A0A199VHJ4_ANACO|nr:hypothetical protein ACMD2_21418 [Ananas comosus]
MSDPCRCLVQSPSLNPRPRLSSRFRVSSARGPSLPPSSLSFGGGAGRRASFKKWRLDHISCFKHEEESTSHCNAFEHVEVQKNEGLRKAESDELKANGKHWLSSIQKVANRIFVFHGDPWTVPWTAETIIKVMLLWIATFWFVGSWIIPFLAHAAGFSKDTLTHRGQALYSLLTDIAEGLAGIAILHRCLAPFRPLPPGWFSFKLRGSWHFDVLFGCLLFPLVNLLSHINISMVPNLPGLPVGVSSVEQSIVARDPVAMALYAVVVSVCAPVWEEIVFRGFLLPSLTRYMPLNWSIVVSAAAFALAHFNSQRLLPLVFLGVVMGAVFARSRNLLASMLLHSLWNGFVFLDLMK